jgi:hypothetical protein
MATLITVGKEKEYFQMQNIITNLETVITRKVRDIDHMILCDGFQYGIITYRGNDQLVRRPRSMVTWRFVMDLEATIKADIAAEQRGDHVQA